MHPQSKTEKKNSVAKSRMTHLPSSWAVLIGPLVPALFRLFLLLIIGHMMTFLSVSDTAVCGRTCHTWLQVAYHRSPTKLVGSTFVLAPQPLTSANERVDAFLRSPYKRHFDKCHLEMGLDHILERLCANMDALTEFTLSINLPSDNHELAHTTLSLSPLLQYHSSTLTRATFIGVALKPSHLAVISHFSSLITLEVLRAELSDDSRLDESLLQSQQQQQRSLKPVRWGLQNFRTLCHPNNQLKHLRDFRFDTTPGPMSSDYLEPLKNLPLEAITSITPTSGMTKDFLEEIGYFKLLRCLAIHIKDLRRDDSFSLVCDALRSLTLLDTLSLRRHHFALGQLATLLENQSRLTSLSLEAVTFESPACLTEIPHHLIDLKFQECGTVGYEHLVALASLHALQRLTHLGWMVAHTRLTQDQLQQFTPSHSSCLLPALKKFDYDWPRDLYGNY